MLTALIVIAASLLFLIGLSIAIGIPFFPAMGDWVPAQDQALDAFATNFDTIITANPTDYGLVAGDATAFNTLRLAFTNGLAAATNPSTRTPATVAAKDTARNAMVALLREDARIAQAYPAITNELLSEAGLPIRDAIPSPIPAPVSSPILSMMQTASLQHTLRFRDSVLSNPRSKPPGAIAMQLYVKTTAGAPTQLSDCRFVGQFSRMPAVVDYDGADAGDLAQYIAVWVTARGLQGPLSAVFSATIPA